MSEVLKVEKKIENEGEYEEEELDEELRIDMKRFLMIFIPYNRSMSKISNYSQKNTGVIEVPDGIPNLEIIKENNNQGNLNEDDKDDSNDEEDLFEESDDEL
jgi:hypothetical protein